MTKATCLEKAIEITKEHARGGGANPVYFLEQVYDKIVELNNKAGNERASVSYPQ